MIPRRTVLLLVLVSGFVSACADRSYDVRGRVVGFGSDGRTIFVQHEEIPGLMPSMTMPLRTNEHGTVRALHVGDAIAFRMHLNRDSTWISDVRPLRAGELPLTLEDAAPDASTSAVPYVQPGEQMPDVPLVDQDGNSFRLSDYRGRLVLLTFIYTRCPLPDFCPLMTRRFMTIRQTLSPQFEDDVTLLSVTLDPVHDRPSVLRRYAQRETGDQTNWIFATGDEDDVRRLAQSIGVQYTPEGDELLHTLVTALIDEEGRLNATWPGNQWEAEDVMTRMEYVLANRNGAMSAR